MWIDDDILNESDKDFYLNLWSPKNPIIVLGSSNQASKELNLVAVKKDKIRVLKRYGGGGAVVLHPGCIIISLGLWVKNYYQNSFYFKLINQMIIDSLEENHEKIHSLYQDGISDIVYKDKKIAGTSMFRSRNYLLYQASILVDRKIHVIEKYLKHPSKEPEYRRKKSHQDFLSSLNQIDDTLQLEDIKPKLDESIRDKIKEIKKEHLILSQEKQVATLKKRTQRSHHSELF